MATPTTTLNDILKMTYVDMLSGYLNSPLYTTLKNDPAYKLRQAVKRARMNARSAFLKTLSGDMKVPT